MNRLYLYQEAVASHCTIRGISSAAWLVVDTASALTNLVVIRWNNNGVNPSITGIVTHCVAANVDLTPTHTGAPDINNNYDTSPSPIVGRSSSMPLLVLLRTLTYTGHSTLAMN